MEYVGSTNWCIAMMSGKRKRGDKENPKELLEQAKARYRGMAKNNNQINSTFSLENLYMCRHNLEDYGLNFTKTAAAWTENKKSESFSDSLL